MRLQKILAIFIRQLYLIRGNPTRLVSIFLWIGLDLLLWGFITRYLDSLGQAAFSFTTVLLGAIILWGFLVRSQQGVMVGFLEDVWSRNFLNLFSSPLRVREYLAGLILSSLVTSLLGLLFMVFIAGAGFGYNLFLVGLYLFPFLAVLFIFGAAMGIFSAAIVFRFGPSAEWLAWPLLFALSPFAGVYYPISSLPAALQTVARLIPASYVFEGMRSVLLSGSFGESRHLLLIGATLALVYLTAAYLFFVRVYRQALRNGLISRMDTEAS
jgi:ABC-2 type transport system permease protein